MRCGHVRRLLCAGAALPLQYEHVEAWRRFKLETASERYTFGGSGARVAGDLPGRRPPVFRWQGRNYLWAMNFDARFLDGSASLSAWLGFEVGGNPMLLPPAEAAPLLKAHAGGIADGSTLWEGDPASDAAHALSAAVCDGLGVRVGLTKVFLRKGAFERLEAARAKALRARVLVLQTALRRFARARAYARLRRAVLRVQLGHRLRSRKRNGAARAIGARWRVVRRAHASGCATFGDYGALVYGDDGVATVVLC